MKYTYITYFLIALLTFCSSEQNEQETELAQNYTLSQTPFLENLGVTFDNFSPQTGRAGAFLFSNNGVALPDDKVFFEFGHSNVPNTFVPSFNYTLHVDALVFSPVTGQVEKKTLINSNTQEYQVILSSDDNLGFLIELNSIKNFTLNIGDTVTSSQLLGSAGVNNTNSNQGQMSLTLKPRPEYGSGYYCPMDFLKTNVKDNMINDIAQLIVDWENFNSDSSRYDESTFVIYGCHAKKYCNNVDINTVTSCP